MKKKGQLGWTLKGKPEFPCLECLKTDRRGGKAGTSGNLWEATICTASTDVDQGRLCRIPVQKGGLESLREKGSLAS